MSASDAAKIRQRMDGVFAMFPRLSERSSQNAGTLERRRAADAGARSRDDVGASTALFGRAIARSGADRRSRHLPEDSGHQRRWHRACLLVEQNARYAFETASRGYVLQTGSVIASGPCARAEGSIRASKKPILAALRHQRSRTMTLAGQILARGQIRCRYRRGQRYRSRNSACIRRSRSERRLCRSGQGRG